MGWLLGPNLPWCYSAPARLDIMVAAPEAAPGLQHRWWADLGLLNIGTAFWGLLVGVTVSGPLEWRDFRDAAGSP